MAMKSLTTQEMIFIFQTLENSTVQIKAAKDALTLMDKLDNNIQESMKKDAKK